jgi:hypothetical protein
MRKLIASAVALTCIVGMPAMAATTVDFSGHVAGSQIGNTYASLGLTFSPATFGQCAGGCPAPNPNGWFAYNAGNSFTAFFSTAQNNISFQGVTFSDTLAEAYDSSNNLIASVSESIYFPVSNQVNSLIGSGIVRVVFSDLGGPGFGPAITNLTFDAAPAGVPEPATWAMMLLGFGAVGGAMRISGRKQNASVSYA